MSFPDDPNLNPRQRIADSSASNAGMWIAGLAAIAIVAGLIAYSASNSSDTASTDRTGTSPPAATTGSGATSPANKGDAGSAPAKAPAAR